MSIKATCHCGAQFMAKPELAGKAVTCPTCSQMFQVPRAAVPAPSQSTFQVACPCGRTYQVPLAMAGRPVQCKACGQQFVVPQAPAAMRQAATRVAPTPDPLASAGPLDNLGDLSSFGGSYGASMPAANFPAQSPASAPYGAHGAIVRPARKKQGGNKTKIVSIVLGSLVTLAILGIAVGTFVFFPFSTRYATPEAVWEAQKKATENQDWKTLYNTLTPETRDRMASGIAFIALMAGGADESMAAIVKKHGLKSQTTATDTSSPAGLTQMFSQLQQQMESAADSIEDKESFFVDVMAYFAEKGEEMQGQMGNQQMTMMTASQELKDVVIDGDRARGTQTISVMGNTVNVPIEFRQIDGSWLIHQPSMQEMMAQASTSSSLFGGAADAGNVASNPSAVVSDAMGEPADAGKTPEGTLQAYYYYGDRGQQSKLENLIVNNITDQPMEDGPGRGVQTQAVRGVVVDHEERNGYEAILYYRTWFSISAAQRGGRPAVAKVVDEGGVWKLDLKETLKRTLENSKGKTQFGYYDGSKDWWK